MLYSLWHHGARCNVASPEHYFGRTEVSLRVGLQRWQLSRQCILLFDCCCLRQSFSSQFYFTGEFFWREGLFQCIHVCQCLCLFMHESMELPDYDIAYLIIHFSLNWIFTKPVAAPVKLSVLTLITGQIYHSTFLQIFKTILDFRHPKTNAGFSILTGNYRFCHQKL